jgi:predicted RND superfamily exporter protein
MMCFIFGSLKTGLLSMIPNVWPVLLTLGGMGWLGIPLELQQDHDRHGRDGHRSR